MKQYFRILVVLVATYVCFSCTKEVPAELVVTTTELSFTKDGGSQNMAFKTNKNWTAKSSASWLKVTEYGQSSMPNITMTADANPNFDERTATITITVETLTQAINVRQSKAEGLLVTKTEYNLTNEEQNIEVEIQHNVDYEIIIDEACKDWITKAETKGLTSSKITFTISKNESYDNREGKIVVKQKNGSLSETITVKQSQTNGVFITPESINLSRDAQDFSIEVSANKDYEIIIPTEATWITQIKTKGLKTDVLYFHVDNNEVEPRTVSITINLVGVSESKTLLVSQEGKYISIPDANFKKYCVDNFDTNHDGEISKEEAAIVKAINVSGTHDKYSNITSLVGVEYFTSLESLKFDYSNVSSIDLQQNRLLKELRFAHNKISNLNICNNTELVFLDCSVNELPNLDVCNNTKLTHISCSCNSIKTLDVKTNKELESLSCNINDLSSLDISNNSKLQSLNCSGNHITNLDINSNLLLRTLDCSYNLLEYIDISKNSELSWLKCGQNKLKNLDVKSNVNLSSLWIEDNQLTTLDVLHNSGLYSLNCNNNCLTSLDISQNRSLDDIHCSGNQIASLDISKNTSLRAIYCDGNTITNLDVNGNLSLQYLICSNNQLSSLDVSNNLMLRYLDCSKNKDMSELWLSKGQTINTLIKDNQTEIKHKEGAAVSTVAEVINGENGKSYLVEGICSSIINTKYGNWYLQDNTGTIYIYGTLDKNGQYNWASNNIAVGDTVRVYGPRTQYGSTIELVDVTVISVKKK